MLTWLNMRRKCKIYIRREGDSGGWRLGKRDKARGSTSSDPRYLKTVCNFLSSWWQGLEVAIAAEGLGNVGTRPELPENRV